MSGDFTPPRLLGTRWAAPAWWLLACCAAAMWWPWAPMVVWPVAAAAAAAAAGRLHHRSLAILSILLAGLSVWTGARLLVERGRARPEAAARAVLHAYSNALDDLEHRAGDLAEKLGSMPLGGAERLELFRRLDQERKRSGTPTGLTALLLDRDGVALAWSGDGLRHDLPEAELPILGLHSVSSYAAVTLYAVAPLDDSRRPARVVVGRSFATTALPFGSGPPRGAAFDGSPSWSVGDFARTAGLRRSGIYWDLAPERGPVLRVRDDELSAAAKMTPAGSAPRVTWVWLVLALALATAASWREVSSAGEWSLWNDALPPLALALLLVLRGLGTSWPALAIAGMGIALAGLAARGGARAPGNTQRPMAAAALATVALIVAWTSQRWIGPTDLGASLWVSLEGWVVRLGSFAALAAGFWIVSDSSVPGPGAARRTQGLLGIAAIAAAAALLEHPAAAAVLLVLASAALVSTLVGLSRPSRLFATALVGGLVSGIAWGVAERANLRASLRASLDSVVAAARAEVASGALGQEVSAFLAATDLGRLALGPPERLEEPQDLALALWLASPLARHGAPSALLVLDDEATLSSFAYGLPLNEQTADLSTDPRRWPATEAGTQWAENAISGSVTLVDQGQPRAEVRFWYLPVRVPAAGQARSPDRADATTLTRDLLGGHEDDLALTRLRSGIRVELGSASAWRGSSAPAVRVQHVDRRGFTGWSVPGEPFWVAGPAPLVPGSNFMIRLRAPALGPLETLRWAAVHATAVLLALLAFLGLALILALGRSAPRRLLGRWLSSYSRKLVLVSTVLLVLPLALLNLFLLRAFEQRLGAEQRANGDDALRSAERILSDYLPTLEPGFSIETELDDSLLSWLAQVVSHEVNLYWRGYLYASSKRELFTAGILPRRIPGEVYSALDPGVNATVARTNRVAADLSYLELYRSIRLPGEGGAPASARLFLSVPLLAQQEEVTETLAVFRQQALAVTAALLAILIAVVSRLAASFTTPLTQIVRGTGRIAEGATSLGLRPSEPELAALVEAIDAMARRIADARERLMREKQVVDSVVANITSAVVSIGRDSLVQMSNRKAVDLLGCRVGDSLDGLAMRQPVEPLRGLLERRPPLLEQRTARFAGADGEEREWTMVWVPVPGPGDPAALLVVEDVTEVLRGQRLEAWAQMARIIAHEIKNPLTPIRLSAEHLLRVWQEAPERLDEVIERCIDNILGQVSELRDTAADFSTYSQIPSAEPTDGDLVEAVGSVVEGYTLAPPDGVTIRLEAPATPLRLRFDRRLVVRAVRNLIENALHASHGAEGPIDVRVSCEQGGAVIEVADRGPGVPDGLLPRIFEPTFSTHVGGTGLGLPITLRIAEQHGGTVTAANRTGGGLRVTIRLPAGGCVQ
ncbi:MAG TPA: ATP-binding protein [Thermoanaerobaculia bacterium]|nr:ATP-binding protein [Thermoanaerobaculia bacterium]